VIGVRQSDGEALKQAAASGVSATITLPAPKGTSYNVIAKTAGATTPCETITGGHFDSVAVTGGAHDNASGTAGVLEMARVVAANRTPGVHCFILFGAEELGLIGSEYYVEQMTQADRDALKVMLNLDMIGGEEDLTLIGSDDLTEVARIEAQRLGVRAAVGDLGGSASSDHASFEREGMPVVMFNRNDALIHTAQDTIDRMSPAQMQDAVRVIYATLVAVAGR
jgi:aminopeptidase YwaD